ncbi:sensor histidine kinase [Microbacterium alcoholitolerans]|uniref:sensor histidine kinase n=1 Tax=unclassified Microbacterium TaxID=2609290 RepID=UPI000A8661E8
MRSTAGETTRRGPFRRLRDRELGQLVVLCVAAVVLYPILVPVHAAIYGTYLPAAMLLGAAAVTAPLLSRRHPRTAIVLFLAAVLLLPLLATLPEATTIAPWPWSVPMIIVFVVFVAAITLQHGWRHGLLVLAAGTALSLVPSAAVPSAASSGAVIADLIVTTSVAAAALLIAILIAGRFRIADELTRERAQSAQEQARRELVEERTRIARELHDVVAHSMSLIQVQASTARYRIPALADDAAEEFEGIAAAARGSLGEMRRILGVLRTEDHAAELTPQRGIDQIPALVETTRRAGADVSMSGQVVGDVDAAAQIALYRITQEALSNAVRHASGTMITVTLSATSETVSVQIVNSATERVSDSTTPGHGLRGMSERAALLGGAVQAGPADDGGWSVSAWLPRLPASDAAQEGLS